MKKSTKGILFIVGLLATIVSGAQIPTIDHWETVVYDSTSWKYMPGTSDPGNGWNNNDFNDNTWLTGRGGVGYGDGDDRTVINPALSVFLRKKFSIVDRSTIENVMLHVDYDDGFIAYINGVEIARANMGSGSSVAFNQGSAGLHESLLYQGKAPDAFPIDKAIFKNLLSNGVNLLTVQVHNENLTSSDLSSSVFLSVGITESTRHYFSTPAWFIPPPTLSVANFESSNLPVIVINTNNREILDEPKIEADMGIIYNSNGGRNNMSDPFNNYNGKIGIEKRGSSSQTFPKKQYGIELHDTNGMSIESTLLGLPKQSDWILFAPYNDKSLMRDVLAYKMGRDMGRYAPRTMFCELVLNGEYQGIYVLIEKIKRDKNRVDISKLEPTEIIGDDVTGGYLIKIDKQSGSGNGGWVSSFSPPGRSNDQVIYFQYDYPNANTIVAEQKLYIKKYVADFESALAGSNFKDPVKGYANYIDVDSFIDFFLANEVSKNVDGYRLSTYLHKKKNSDGGKLFMGPIWDFNLGYGNANYCTKGNPEGFVIDFNSICNKDYWLIPFWWSRLLEDDSFTERLLARWTTLRQGKYKSSAVSTYIDSVATVLNAESQQRNFQKWPVLGKYIWPNYYVGQTFQQEVDWLKNWTGQRLSWLDANISNIATGFSDNKESAVFSVTVYPNPFKSDFQFEYTLQKPGSVSLELLDLMGRKISEVQVEHDTPGVYVIKNEQNDFTAGVYYYKARLNKETIITGKLLRQ